MQAMKNIKWISLQPLTGGMYLGFKEAFQCDAHAIISYHGLTSHSEGTIRHPRGRSGNEYNLMKYLYDHGSRVPRWEFSGKSMFSPDVNDATLVADSMFNDEDAGPDFSNVDVVCAVPVCSGLSALTATAQESKDEKNCNMQALAKYALQVIKPKVYVFENAPMMVSSRGAKLRIWFEDLALREGYTVSYFKTDTVLHHNCQRRPRTFVMMTKWDGDERRSAPDFNDYEQVTYTMKEYLKMIPEDASLQDSLPVPLYENETTIGFMKEKYPDTWRDWFAGNVINKMIVNGMTEEFYIWCMKRGDSFGQRMMRHIVHVRECLEKGKGWWSSVPIYHKEFAPAVQSRTMYSTIHPTEDRLCSERDMLWMMGMPHDFEMQGSFMSDGKKIGQNVPVKTARWIAQYIKTVIDGWDDIRRDSTCSPRMFDNINKEEIQYIKST